MGVVVSICEHGCFWSDKKSLMVYRWNTKKMGGPDLLVDLCMYTKHKAKLVVRLVRTLLNLYRQVSPEWLPLKMRGRQPQSDDEEQEASSEDGFEEHDAKVLMEGNIEDTFEVARTDTDEIKRVKEKHHHGHTRKAKKVGASISESQKRKKKNTMMLLHGGKLNKRKGKRKGKRK